MGCCIPQSMATRTMTDAIKSAACWINFLAARTLLFAQTMGVLMLALLIAMAIETRDPPLVLVPTAPVAVTAGEWAEIRIPLQRDMTRRCSVTYQPVLIDADGSRFPMPGGAETADGITALEARSPGLVKLMLLIPPIRLPGVRDGVDTGPAELRITRTFSCNPLQDLIPIRAHTSTALYVLP